jgi:endo-1,4-beta-xylanase
MPRARIPSLDGVRAISILLVIAGHWTETHAKGTYAEIGGSFAALGVRIFFVLSGYLITRLLLEEESANHCISLRRFYIRRAWRILPASALFMLITFIVFRRQLSWIHALLAALYLTNFDPGHPWFLGHLWSLSVEEQFYLLWPAALKKWARIRVPMLASALLLSLAFRAICLLAHQHGKWDETLFAQVEALAVGCLMPILASKLPAVGKKLAAALLFGILSAVICSGAAHFYLRPLLLLVLGPLLSLSIAGLLLYVMRFAPRLLNVKPVVWLGTLSYGLYLWQQPFAFGPVPRPAALLPLALVMACVSYYCVERPALRIGAKLANSASTANPLNPTNQLSSPHSAVASLPVVCLGVLAQSVVLIFATASICGAQSLRQEADHDGLLIGAAVRPSLLSEHAYASTLAREFNMVEPEDAMKWMTLRPDQKTYDFHQGDEIVRFARANQMKVRGHCLVWDHNNPDWLTQGHFTSKQLSRLLHEHITRVMKHYRGQVFAWDVINESIDEKGHVRNSLWYNQPGIGLAENGTAYIEQVFRWAHKADPHALLFYNEAEGEGMNHKSDVIYAMVKDFKHRGVPIDGVGLQMHVPALDADIPALAANITRLAALGVQLHITELDVSLPVNPSGHANAQDLNRQADIYRGIVRVCLDNPGCTAIQTWGFTDKYSWIGSHSRGARGQALPFDQAYQPKAAYLALHDELLAGRAAPHY